MAIIADPVTDFCVGNPLNLPRVASELPAPAQTATISIFSRLGDTTSRVVGPYTITNAPDIPGQITDQGELQPDGTYTAQFFFALSSLDTARLAPGAYSYAAIEVSPGPYATEIVPLWPLLGGPHG